MRLPFTEDNPSTAVACFVLIGQLIIYYHYTTHTIIYLQYSFNKSGTGRKAWTIKKLVNLGPDNQGSNCWLKGLKSIIFGNIFK